MELDEELDEIHFDEEKALRVRNSSLLVRLDLFLRSRFYVID